MSRRVKVFVLCEDLQASTLIRQYLVLRGYPKRSIRVHPLPSACGSQWVRERYARAVRANRTRHVTEHLVVHIDADDHDVEGRHSELAAALDRAGLPARGIDEPIALIVPEWETETWLHHFRGRADVAEDHKGYPKFTRPNDAATSTASTLLRCVQGEGDAPANLPSFDRAVRELRRLP